MKWRKLKISKMKWAGYTAWIWSLLYIPIHIYWASGGTGLMPGVWKDEAKWEAVNWGASVVLLQQQCLLYYLFIHEDEKLRDG